MIPVQLEERPAGRSSDSTLLHPAVPYVLPFVAFLALLSSSQYLHALLGTWEYPVRVGILGLILWTFSRHVIDLRTRKILGSILLGVVVFAVWVAPDLFIPGYRQHWLFQNSITGGIQSSIPDEFRNNAMVLIFRTIRAVILVPIIEELFWRAWLLRWLISPRFQEVPLGAYTAMSMWISAILFASEHGPYWEVGLLAGLAYNFWMVRTKSLGDCILAHAVTNGALSLFVIATGRWEYWL